MPEGGKGTSVPLLTILTPCYNEEETSARSIAQVKAAMATLPDYDYDHLFIDNASTDKTVEILRELAATTTASGSSSTRATSARFGPRTTRSCRPAATPSWAASPIFRIPRS